MPKLNATLIREPTALVAGSAVYLLARLLKAPPVANYIRGAVWLRGPDFSAAVRAINGAADAWQTSLELSQRRNEVRCELSWPGYSTITVEQASEQLHVSRRRVQHLARSGRISGCRKGRRWELESRSVAAYQQHQRRKRAG
ncbi:MAG: helix-turn-helix domain-containing protein [Pseudonocardiales bacterium]|nr:helix-turn-helix domain-containing protein [Pseudonocardiales bacterium]